MKAAAEIQKKIGGLGDVVVLERREDEIELGVDDGGRAVASDRIDDCCWIAFLLDVEDKTIHANAELSS